MIKKAIIPAAGYGTRSLPITKVVPKELFPIGNKPAIHYVVEEAVLAGVEEILIIVSRTKNMISDYFDRSLELETFLKQNNKSHLLEKMKIPEIRIQYIRQTFARGLGDAILLGKSFVGNEAFAVLLPDEIILGHENTGLSQLVSQYEKHKNSVLGLAEVEQHKLSNYGVISPENKNDQFIKVASIVEKPKLNPPSNLAVMGRYIFNPAIFHFLEKTKPDATGEIQLTDAMNSMLLLEDFDGILIEGDRYDISKLEEYIAANQFVQFKEKC
ncbi:UTP--glucose-1-phosphate uridylyltransferase [Bacillus oleivorans]|uniref:UTP--glucose-1-phosphate uridylyltransferase n=1 Tax=Bacillus oleivorans TaxID=1448271 RepID=A0A285CQ42_9BACI|nr:UTP--glucose-1-phosphate uridylyltransferase [Bacillus oleivorans]SNX69651.1 UTP--glucose-1-phosphate uridylyltransferase [Bacillus oleivorans]